MNKDVDPHWIIMSEDGSYALVSTRRKIDDSQEAVDVNYYEIRAPHFIPTVISARDYNLSIALSPAGFTYYKEYMPDLEGAIGVVRERYTVYDPSTHAKKEKEYQDEFSEGEKKAKEERKKRTGGD